MWGSMVFRPRRFLRTILRPAIYLIYKCYFKLAEWGVIAHSDEPSDVKSRNRIKPDISLETFFRELNARGVQYVVLRWFEDLPEPNGRDVDILLRDSDLPKITDLTTNWPLGIRCDLYTSTGQYGYGHRGVALFPPALADRILSNARRHNELISVPNQRDHFFALAYHATYIKGAKSGLPSEFPIPKMQGSHDYAVDLTAFGADVGIVVPAPVTMESLDALLNQHGWRPPIEMLERLAENNEWLALLLEKDANDERSRPDGLAAFMIRQRAVDLGLEDLLIDRLEMKGFEILARETLNADLQNDMAKEVRGGNWGRGPYPVSGGKPATLVIGYDVMTSEPTEAELAKFPLVDNRRILFAKTAARDVVMERYEAAEQFNPMHSTDNARQSWRIVENYVPALTESLCAAVEARKAQFETLEPVVRTLSSFGTRAKVELVRWEGQEVVKKTFKNVALRHLEREVAFLTEFSDRPEVPKLLKRGTNYILLPYYENDWTPVGPFGIPRLLPLAMVRQIADFFKSVVAQGVDLIDINPRANVIVDRREGLKILDFEFVHRHGNPLPPEKCYAIAGVPKNFDGDYPTVTNYIGSPYPKRWFPHTGLSPHSLFYDSPLMQSVKRLFNYPVFLFRWSVTKAVFSDHGLKGIARRVYRMIKGRVA